MIYHTNTKISLLIILKTGSCCNLIIGATFVVLGEILSLENPYIDLFSRWRHQMEIFSALLALCARKSPVTCDFPSQRPVKRSFDVSLIWAWMHGRVNNREAGDLRRHRAHYDVIVMCAVCNTILFCKGVCLPLDTHLQKNDRLSLGSRLQYV